MKEMLQVLYENFFVFHWRTMRARLDQTHVVTTDMKHIILEALPHAAGTRSLASTYLGLF